MKTKLLFLLSLMLCCFQGFMQQNQYSERALGSVSDFLNQMETKSESTQMMLVTSDAGQVQVKVNFRKASSQNLLHIEGEVISPGKGSFSIRISPEGVIGHVVMPETSKAYRYYSDKQGTAFIKEVDIHSVLCIGMPGRRAAVEKVPQQKPTIDPAVGNLQSLPGAIGCILLDFDGYEMPAGNGWNNGNAVSAAPSTASNADITTAWQIISEDFMPFSVNVTTNESVFNTYAQNKRRRCVVTPTNFEGPTTGGVAYLGSFSWNNDTPCWVFATASFTGVDIGEIGAHEIGHTLGLSHDGIDTIEYYDGHGTWAPIMGVGYYRNVRQWSKGEYTGATNTQDDLAIIANDTNGVGYRPDDYSNLLNQATPLNHTGGVVSAAQNKGVIETTGDQDLFSFTTTGGTANFIFSAIPQHSDLRLQASIYNNALVLQGTYFANAADLGQPVNASLTLAPGDYYLVINGAANGTANADYTNYASLGAYNISGTYNVTPLPVAMDQLKGEALDKLQTLLSWNTFTEYNNQGFEMQRSHDAKNFRTIGTIPSQAVNGNSLLQLSYQFTDATSLPGKSFYRLIQRDADGKENLSNVVKIVRDNNGNTAINIYPNPVQSQLTIDINGPLQKDAGITITDMTGRKVWSQLLQSSKTTIDMAAFASGTYSLQYTDDKNALVYKVQKK